MVDLVVRNARITTLDPRQPNATAIAVADGRIVAVGDDAQIMALAKGARTIDAQGRRLLPGLNDSHTHLIRGGLNYNLELRWDGVRSLADAMAMLKAQVDRTPAPQWVRVVGGFTAYQFAEKRLPTLEEINAIAPETPVFLLHLYDRALLNRAALRACGYDKATPDPPGGRIERDKLGNPTGLLLAKPNALILYASLAKGPRLPLEYQANSTRHFMRELNRLGVTSVIDAGGGFQNYPEDYQVIEQLHAADQLSVRIAYNLFTQNKGREVEDFRGWTEVLPLRKGDDLLRHNGAGEMLVFSAADFEQFSEPRPELPAELEPELEQVVRLLVEKRWPFRIHATYDESIARILDVYEKVNADIPFDGLHWFIDHAETITPRNIERIRALNGGIAVQHRMASRARRSCGAMACRLQGRRRQCDACSQREFRSAQAPMPPAWPATTRGWRCRGWSPAARWAVWPCMATRICSIANRHCGCGRRAAPGFPVTRPTRAPWRRGSWPTSSCCPTITSASTTRPSPTSPAC
ncbi:amidohydrolase family protein [Xanthomonas citri pv. mangiferaeindicae LMG 941]|nr:amidohydrolase family protein [Xanthomonas citri pv. mangiferaeindicae]CCG39166.1 amidohydrolase family protein [Xanthomonas citri pv. mangiferaeindicae LMG 941]